MSFQLKKKKNQKCPSPTYLQFQKPTPTSLDCERNPLVLLQKASFFLVEGFYGLLTQDALLSPDPWKVSQARVSLPTPEIDFEWNQRDKITKKVHPKDSIPPLFLMSGSWLRAFLFCLHIFSSLRSLSLSSLSSSSSSSSSSCPSSDIWPVLSSCPFTTTESRLHHMSSGPAVVLPSMSIMVCTTNC